MVGGLSGPGYYDARVLPTKESFNFGHVPFGSGIDRSRLKGGALQATSLETPGPGSYNAVFEMGTNRSPYKGGVAKAKVADGQGEKKLGESESKPRMQLSTH